MNSRFAVIKEDEMQKIDGGLLAGGLAGAILGGTAGLVGGTVATIVTGDTSGKTLYKWTSAGALAGGAVGAYTPV